MAIGAAAGVAESVAFSLIDGLSISEMVVDAAISGTIGAIADAGGGTFTKNGIVNELAESISTLHKKM